mmetsp:Transcript_32810/g.90542  ORF Transcript_32810/g.90542 Transcript_32810/m.90542 type:complete len:81 (+) Transcript_32810:158-400(+)
MPEQHPGSPTSLGRVLGWRDLEAKMADLSSHLMRRLGTEATEEKETAVGFQVQTTVSRSSEGLLHERATLSRHLDVHSRL